MYKYYFDETNHKVLGYYCRYKNMLFKTKEEYESYINNNNISTKDIMFWRMSKISSPNRFDKDGSWVKFNVALGTELFDNRDLSKYYISDQRVFDRFMKCYDKYGDFYIDRCYYGGYDNTKDYTYTYDNGPLPKFDETKENRTYAFYIISYMPDDEGIRRSRMSAHLLQIKNLKRLAPNTRIYVIAQNWNEKEYLNDPQITYCKFGKLGAGKARNVAFKMLYESNYDYGCFSDDDITLKETDSAKEFFRELAENPAKFIKMDIIQNRCLIYNALNYQDLVMSGFTSRKWHFVQAYEGQVHLAFIKNFKKYYDEEEYQDEVITPKNNTGFDDTDFYLSLVGKGYTNYMATFLYRYLGCMEEKDSVVEDVSNPCFVYDNLCAARRRHLSRLPNGSWDYWKLQKPLPDINIDREVHVDTLKEMSGHLIDALKLKYEQQKKPILTDFEKVCEKDKEEIPIDGDYEII